MPAPFPALFRPDDSGAWWQVSSQTMEASGGLAASPFAMPAFFLGWAGIGGVVALRLARRGHDRRLMVALGAALGPFMIIVASDAVAHREREARPLVLAPGLDHGGDLDVAILLQGRPEDVRSVVPTIFAVQAEIGLVSLARAVPYEWLDDGTQPPDDDGVVRWAEGAVENNVIAEATAALVAARDLMASASPALVVFPGLAAHAAERVSRPNRRVLVLTAIDEDAATSARR